MRSLIILSLICFSQTISAKETLWNELDSSYQFRTAHSAADKVHTARKMSLDYAGMKSLLTTASRASNIDRTISLPSPDGKIINFRVEPTSVMSPELAQRYPDIKTWKIIGTENPAVNGRIDIGPRGFHGLFHTTDGDRVFIDPEHQEGSPQTEIYTILSSHENHGSSDSNFTCELHGEPLASPFAAKTFATPSAELRTYRLAVAVTGEYTQLFGGTKGLALAGVTTTVNRINQVFERDLNVHLELIKNNDEILFTSPSADPYTNQDASAMVEENILALDALIGTNNYDIGHVFGTGNTGGLAFLSSTCGLNKAGGVTGSNSPEGEAFNIDYVAHEIGHQLGASHTFNGFLQNCNANNRAQNSAVEPGSGSSIMGYAGICGDDDLQANSNSFFHSHSIAQVRSFTQEAGGSSCGTSTATTNNNPEVDAGENFNIPAQTPFVLSGLSTDIDGDATVNSWEQTDTGASADLYSDVVDNPLFRIWNPTASSTRYFPRLTDLLNNTTTLGELLPTTNRVLSFSLLARDNKGGVATDSVTLNVIDTGMAFAITSNDIPSSLSANDLFELNWDVAGTDKAPINCSSVNIGFVTSNAYHEVISKSPNDGSETITLPIDVVGVTGANIKISCSNNIFFAVSSTKHFVKGGAPVLSINPPSLAQDINGARVLAYTLSLSSPATEEIFIFYNANTTANKGATFSGEAVIAAGQTSTTIRIPVTEDTLTAAVRATQLVIQESENGQFQIDSSALSGSTDVAGVTTVAAAPAVAAAVSEASGGGGSFGPYTSLVLFLLMLVRFRSRVFASA